MRKILSAVSSDQYQRTATIEGRGMAQARAMDLAALETGRLASIEVELNDPVSTGAVVIPGVSVGARAIVGAGATAIKDVPEGVTVIGTPARQPLRKG